MEFDNMKSRFFVQIAWTFLVAITSAQSSVADTNRAPAFQDIYNLIRQNLAEVKESDLNQAAVKGLIAQLGPYVMLVDPKTKAEAANEDAIISDRTAVFDEHYGYVRLGQVNAELPGQFRSVLNQLQATNNLRGLVLDLRFATGQDYVAAAKTANLFISEAKPLLQWGDTKLDSTAKTHHFSLPLAILINLKTSGAAEALAGILRQTDTALLLGGSSAGKALLYRDFPLENETTLRIASAVIRLGDNRPLPITGIMPDIQVVVSQAEESAFYQDAYWAAKPATNLVSLSTKEGTDPARNAATNRSRHRLNEADLVRMKKEGQRLEEEPTFALSSPLELSQPTIQDPALARALDLLKGLAVIRLRR
jgi:C-terminal processing protease CtpA/Prc